MMQLSLFYLSTLLLIVSAGPVVPSDAVLDEYEVSYIPSSSATNILSSTCKF